MEDDNGLELSLGLACGRSSSPSIGRSDNSADARTDADERTSMILNDFRNFLNAGVPEYFQRTKPKKPQEKIFNNFQRTASGGNDSVSGARSNDNKRKSTFVGTKNNKKREIDSYSSVLQVKEKCSHISFTTDEGSIGDDEDVAESAVEGSTSRTASYRDGGSASSYQATKEKYGKSNISATSFPVQTMNISSVPYSITLQESPSSSKPSTPVYPSSMRSISSKNGEHQHPHAMSNGSVPMSFTHSSVQIAVKDSPWGMSRLQPQCSPYSGRSTPTPVSMRGTNHIAIEPAQPAMRPLGQLRILPGQNLASVEGSSSQSEARTDAWAQANTSFPSEYPAIKPGIAAEMKFGGSGSVPNLPWVSTTGPGPNGKTVSGVTYKYNAIQIKIVCACHGLHLTPEEFVRHATEDHPSADTSIGFASIQSSNPTTSSAKS